MTTDGRRQPPPDGIADTVAAPSVPSVAAPVGTRDIGRRAAIALSKGDTGLGPPAGVSIALLALIADRVIRDSAAAGRFGG